MQLFSTNGAPGFRFAVLPYRAFVCFVPNRYPVIISYKMIFISLGIIIQKLHFPLIVIIIIFFTK